MAGTVPYPLRLDEELSARVRALAAESGVSVNRTLNDLVRSGLVARVTAERARSRLGDPAWIEAAGREIREADGEILDLLSR